MKRVRRGRFVVLEGLDGSGTTTQTQRLADWLRENGRQVFASAEPSGGPIGVLIRQILSHRLVGGGKVRDFDPVALALLFAADRADHLSVEIEPRLARGIDVVSDRFTLSSLAYQGLTVRGRRGPRDDSLDAAIEWVQELNRSAIAPDLTIFLEVAPGKALRRRRAASPDPELFERSAFQRSVAASYGLAMKRLQAAGERVRVVDGARTVSEVTAAVVQVVRTVL